MAAVAAASIDLEQPGKYPIVLSDALLGKPSTDVFTGIRYNHKPDSATSSLTLKPSDEPTNYDLSFSDNADKYSYTGARLTGNGQYVLIFDAVKKHFVLHRVDSTFDMNLVSAPWDQDAESLRSQYPQLESNPKHEGSAGPKKPSKSAKHATVAKSAPKRQKVEKEKKKPAKEPTPEPERDDSDDGLTVEYPDGSSSQTYQHGQHNSAFQKPQSEASDEDEDAKDDYDDEHYDVDQLKLPSPARNHVVSEDDMELDLEAELEQALNETAGGGDESSESEEE